MSDVLLQAQGITKRYGGINALTAVDLEAEIVAFASFDGSPESVELIKQGKLVAASMQQTETSVPTILVTPENVEEIESQLQDTVFPVEVDAATPAACMQGRGDSELFITFDAVGGRSQSEKESRCQMRSGPSWQSQWVTRLGLGRKSS